MTATESACTMACMHAHTRAEGSRHGACTGKSDLHPPTEDRLKLDSEVPGVAGGAPPLREPRDRSVCGKWLS